MTLSPWLGAAEMIILWHIRFPLLTLICISVAFSPRPLGTGMHFQSLLSPLLKVPRMVLLNSLLWWELGTSLPGHGPGEWLSFWRVTNNTEYLWGQLANLDQIWGGERLHKVLGQIGSNLWFPWQPKAPIDLFVETIAPSFLIGSLF